MTDLPTGPVDAFVGWTSTKQADHPFYSYEPWDGPPGEPPRHEKGGAKFQIAMEMSTKYMRMNVSSSQTGKTRDRAIEAVIMMTGELPYSMRHPFGKDTGIKRAITKMNIRRWGRLDSKTGKLIDHDVNAPLPSGWEEWNCGNIAGVGIYPAIKVCHEKGGQLWICSYKQARDDTWVELLGLLIPKHCLKKEMGTEGYSRSEFIFYLNDDKSIRLKTFDQGWERVEAKKAHHIILDEEPPRRDYYTGCVMHADTISFSFTPLRGMSFTYTDLYLRAVDGDPDIELFHATKYDSPYTTVEEIAQLERQLKRWEADAKIYGRYSQQEGRPYYDYDLCQMYLKQFVPRHKLARIVPAERGNTVRETLYKKVTTIEATETGNDVWEIYEPCIPGTAYWMGIDCARGADEPDAVLDESQAYIFRLPIAERGEQWPKKVAALSSTDVTESFAWLCLYGAMHYNFALMNVETKGEDGSAFYVELREYPFWFTMTVTRHRDRRTTEIVGFDTNQRTRTPLFNKLRKYANAHEDKSDIQHFKLLKEMSEIIWRKGRPDHPAGGTSDKVVAFCLGLWVWEEAPNQIRDNSKRFKKEYDDTQYDGEPFLGLTKAVRRETKPILGSSRGMDRRNRDRCLESPKAQNTLAGKNYRAGVKMSKMSGTF
jgi:phage terminase large subunit-like protein